MKGRTQWIALVFLVMVSAGLVLVSSSRQGDALDHDSNNDGFHGTSALRLLAAQRGHPTGQLDLTFTPQGTGLLFILSPSTPFSARDAQHLVDFVRGGGIAVYADEQLDARIASEFKLRVSNQPIPTIAQPATPVFSNVRRVSDETTSRFFISNPEQAALLRHAQGPALAVESRLGSGRLIALSSPCLVCNGYLTRDDNAILAADLLALVPPGSPIQFDEFHHGPIAGTASDWNLTPFGVATWWAALILFIGLAVRGRAFGPRSQVPGVGARSSAEYTVAVGHLLRQAGGGRLALEVAAAAARRELADRIGVRRDSPPSVFADLLRQRAPELARRYEEALAVATPSGRGEASLLRAARRLHALAYPIGPKPR